ncbi:DUF6345 domain-containing protein [Gordonia jinhuaensis]|uniref:Uncharacterized protein n=1 Tax=Gordonia jinhuaensis TaxID=1517702 RepID=A0A916WYS6_9ACTN|nr:DUF6345 domain-containing protein [Gordonia jinhuaensis]GGB39983.1 hypothetical protein GCM10011489_29520 [Gordonia jinhuaensis]
MTSTTTTPAATPTTPTETVGASRIGVENPFPVRGDMQAQARGEGTAAAPDNQYGGCAIQVFDANTGAGNLGNTHADAQGFLSYVNQFDQINFYFEDAGVKPWEYLPSTDDYQGFYGMDAVRVFYHSGHGAMASDGTFYAPMGAAWGGQDWAVSSSMSIGDQYLRYMFWSTCESLEVLGGQSPITTWNPVNKGLRMIFGFHSTSVDSGDYGKNFFSEWGKGKSFSQAWQDASLDISTNMIVSSAACGATQQECQDRLWNERLFYGDAGSNAWYWWRWAGNAPGSVARIANLEVPGGPTRMRLLRKRGDAEAFAELASRYGLCLDGQVPAGHGSLCAQGRGRKVIMAHDGTYEVAFGEPDRNATLASHQDLRAAADRAIDRFGVAEGIELVYDRTTATYHAGGPVDDADISDPRVADVTVHYRQVIGGVPVVMGSHGHVRVTLDPTGAVTRLVDRTRPVGEAVPKNAVAEEITDPEAELSATTQALLRTLAASGVLHDRVETVPNTTEVGYRLTSGMAELVARREVDVVTGPVRKRHVVEAVL